MMNSNHAVSTHVLDTVHGGAAVGVKVKLFKANGDDWVLVNEDVTGEDGRAASFITTDQFNGGTFKFVFALGDYFKSRGSYCIFPSADVIFECQPKEKYHIPLLVSSYSYTTYRGK